MKKYFLIKASVLMLVLACSFSVYSQTEPEVNGPQIQFDKETHDYGKVPLNGDGNCKFAFTNIGTEPLILTNVRAGCGCTVPQWPREPVLPGESAEIKVRYTTLNRPHTINKSIVVTSNSVDKSTVVLRIKGEVVAAATDSTSPEKAKSEITTPDSK
ncbi:MAG TPA: DUF1573 domain-containing protein [Bacteroidales bacterium]|nr:DUF1573 domain-containing protein [Bacteroidales bacterium]